MNTLLRPTREVQGAPVHTVGIVGIGAMGGAMARNLQRRGHPPLVHDIDARVVADAERSGLQPCASTAVLAARSEVVVVVVVDAPQIEAVLFGPDGVVAARRDDAGPRQTVVLCSTIAPEDTERFAKRLATHGIDTVDAPISGGPARAERGEMSMMVAASQAVFTRCEPLLRWMADPLHVVGERIGDGARVKLVNNLLAGIHLVAGAEAMALGERLGLDRQRLFELIQSSSGASWILGDRMPRALTGDLQPARARTALLNKDVGLAVQMAAAAGVEVPMGARALAVFNAAMAAGVGDCDDASVIGLLTRTD